METLKTNFKGLKIFVSKNIFDNRGFFRELFIKKKTKNNLIFIVTSKSKKNVIRGLHMQTKKQQGKFVSVVKGKILDVCVDCRKNSKTFGKHYSIYLSGKENKSLLIPAGFAHGFCTLSDDVLLHYKCSKYRNSQSETGILWNDGDLNIAWPKKKFIISEKDKNNLSFKNLKKLI